MRGLYRTLNNNGGEGCARLKYGMHKSTTTSLQNFLNSLNPTSLDYAPIEVDGLFGPDTIERLREFIREWIRMGRRGVGILGGGGG
ncbi:hypothetical protein TL16_g07177 [Triparma laevis f. inornata]|uniref:Uncharacterized protein n=2 Tax=Triparma laevis TaxID=1534972 RepID=A0A9W7FQE3_9STRA|nr:hypothetical protein TL16_g07177 [Triparma laevis f. inornata]GMI17032.1 hypothetical protein TrLO_g15311 [Triparma laevis f. longispina]